MPSGDPFIRWEPLKLEMDPCFWTGRLLCFRVRPPSSGQLIRNTPRQESVDSGTDDAVLH